MQRVARLITHDERRLVRDAWCVTPDAHRPMHDTRNTARLHDTAGNELGIPAGTPTRMPMYKIDDKL